MIGALAVVTSGCGADAILGSMGDDPSTQVAACIDVTTIQVSLADPAGTERWEAAGRSEEGLRATCEELAASDPDTATALEAEWQRMQEFFSVGRRRIGTDHRSVRERPGRARGVRPQLQRVRADRGGRRLHRSR
jgi:hypothetical protein